jgi:xylulokinase
MILTIDLGTTYFKISLFDREGGMCHTHKFAPPVVAPRAGYMELPCEDLAGSLAQGIAEIRNRAGGDLENVEAVTFATQTNSFALLDAENRPLTPLILWPDRRAEHLEAEVRRHCDIPGFHATTGFSRINFQCMPAKLLWLRNQSPDLWKRTSKLCLIGDFFTFLLTGKHVTEAGAAGLTGLIDIHRCRWYPEMLARFEIDESRLPAIVRAGTDLGPIDPRAASRFGLPKTCRFIVGCLDQYAGAIGAGNVEMGMFSETTGTVLATVRCADQFAERLGPAVLQGPAFREGLYWRMAFGEVSANYLEWFREQLPDRPDFERLLSLAEDIAPGADGLRLRTNVGLCSPEKVFGGLAEQHTRGHQVRCILEAVACALGDQMEALSDGSPPREIRCAGGAARSDVWLQIKADMLGVATAATVCPEPTSLGAAMLAQAALEGTEVESVARQWACLKPPHCPNPNHHRQYHRLRSNLSKYISGVAFN